MTIEQALITPPLGRVQQIVKKTLLRLEDKVRDKIVEGNTSGLCFLYSSSLEEILCSELPVTKAKSDREDGNGHRYLLLPDVNPESDIIVDPTLSQFLPQQRGIFVGTRASLRQLTTNPETQITCTKIEGLTPNEIFEKIWGNNSINLS